MGFDELKQKALSLPAEPGVYIMRDQRGTVIYVGKAKKLKNRVSQYFQDTASHTPKTRIMVSKIDSFDVIVAASEFEALVLECSLIKQHSPKYNILLKDDKGYPYIRLGIKEQYPTITIASKPLNDGAEYFGPFGSRGTTQSLLKSVRQALKLPDCNRKFPRDIGKDRTCLNYHMGQCVGWCQMNDSESDYKSRISQARQLFQGDYKGVSAQIRTQMLDASERLDFEFAAKLRDRLKAVEALSMKQTVTKTTSADTDVIGFYQTEVKACFSVLHFSEGNLLDKECETFSAVDDGVAAVSSLVKQFYLNRRYAPKVILLPWDFEDRPLLEDLLQQELGRKTAFRIPKRGTGVRLVELALKNAQEEAERLTDRDSRLHAALTTLGKMLSIDPPKRIESFDISNISGTDNVAGMVVFRDGKPAPREYKYFKIDNLDGQDDYASMAQVVERRFARYLNGDRHFDILPDLLLIDGGVSHASIVAEVLLEKKIRVPVVGMVKDDKHRTRALVTPEGQEISISAKPAVFSFIGTIQEQTHNFAINYHRKLRSRRLRYSELDNIDGVGPKRKALLLKSFGSLTAIRNASLTELERILPKQAANAVFNYFAFRKEG